jgi:hypothetical protein
MTKRVRELLPVLCAVALLVAALPRPELARAVGFTVDTQTDAPHDLPINGNCTSTLGPGGVGGPCTLRAAVQAANFLGGAQTINLPAGTYLLTVLGSDEDNAASGDLDILGNVTILGAGTATTIIDGNGTDRVFDVGRSAPAQLTLSGATVQHGKPPSSAFVQPEAGGIRVATNSAATLTNVVITQNNTPPPYGVITGGGILSNGALTLTNVTMSGNTAAGAGAALAVTAGTATLDGVIISGNVANGGHSGGGVFNSATLIIHNSTIAGNSADSFGGGGIDNNGNLTVNNAAFTNNTAPVGGAIDNNGTANLTNVTISGNAGSPAFHGGGAIRNKGGGVLTLTNVTIVGNTGASEPPPGGQLLNDGSVTLKNTILANPTTDNVSNPATNCRSGVDTPLTSAGNNLSSDSSCQLSGPGDRHTLDPRLGPLADNGGPTQTHALLSDSPAVDAGTNTGCPTTDQRGMTRVDGTGHGGAPCDIGAFEYQPPPLAATRTPTPTATATPIDTTAPQITSLTINGGAVATTFTSVTVSVTATDDYSGVAGMSFSNDGSTWSTLSAYAATAPWTLSTGDGTKTVYARVRDRRGNVSPPVTATIKLDAAAGTDYGVTVNQGALFTNTVDVTLTIGARANTAQMQVSNDGGFANAQWEPYNSRKPWQITQFGNFTIPRTVYVKYKDVSGNVTGTFQDDIILDVTPPTGSVALAQGAGPAPAASRTPTTATRDPVATLTLSANDDVSGVADMRLSNRGDFAGAQWEPFASSKSWNFDNANTVYVQYRDHAGNVSQSYSVALGTVAQATPTMVPTCAPRPAVAVTSTPSGGNLQVTVAASGAAHATLQTLRIGAATNALIDAGSQTGLTGNATITLPAGTQQTTFTVRRATAGQGTTVPLTITDSCGDWPTLVGGGPGAF